MRLFAKRSWLAIGAVSLASLGCGHTRTVRTEPAPVVNRGTVIVASRTAENPSVFVVETPQSTGTIGTPLMPKAMPSNPTPVVKEMSPTIPAPSPMPKVKEMPSMLPSSPSVPTAMPKDKPVPTMSPDLPKTSSLPSAKFEKGEVAMKPISDPLALPSVMPVDIPKPSTIAPLTPVVKTSLTREKMGHAADYSWLVGRLEYSKSKQQWRIRYASHEVEDLHGGSVTLVGMDDLLEKYADGDLVKIDGQLLDAESKGTAPQYRATAVRKAE